MTIIGPEDSSRAGADYGRGGLQIKPKNIQADSFVDPARLHNTFTVVVDAGGRRRRRALPWAPIRTFDVLVYRDEGTGAPVGYAASRVPMIDGSAEFDPPAWDTTYTMLPVTNSRSDATVTWALVSDGLPFSTPIGQVPNGLTIDRAIVSADIAGLIDTTRWFPAVPD